MNERGQGLGLGWKYREPFVYGGMDTETVNGMPYTLQVADNKGRREIIWLYGQARIARNVLYDIIDSLPEKNIAVFGFYFFKYDVQVLLRDQAQLFTGLASLDKWKNPKTGEWEYDFKEDGFCWSGVITWPTVFVIIRKGSRVLLLIDLFRFFEGGLARVAVDLQLPFKKLEVPACVKEAREPSPAEKLDFEAYAMQDAVVALSILEIVKNFIEEHQISWCLSNAHMAYKIFKKEYTKNEKTGKPQGLDKPDYFMQLNGLKSYHGGRNSLTVSSLPFVCHSARVYDVNSMYPFVGTMLPGFFGGTWSWELDSPDINTMGIYQVTGKILKGKAWPYQLIMAHDGSYLQPGGFQKVWMTGIEIITARKYGMLEIKECVGFSWQPRDSKKKPFRDYFEHYYEEKTRHKGTHPVLYEQSKKLMNCLYGKMASCIPHHERDKNGRKTARTYLTPGAAFNSPIASLFTAHSRTIIFEAEIEYGSYQSATDAIYIPGPKFPDTNTDLGRFSLETTGELVIGRNKLYAVISPDTTMGSFTGFKDMGGKKVWFWEGRKILKYALHAFMGTPVNFLEAVFHGKTKYEYQRMGNLKESLKRPDVIPLAFNTFPAQVKWGGKYGASEKNSNSGSGNAGSSLFANDEDISG